MQGAVRQLYATGYSIHLLALRFWKVSEGPPVQLLLIQANTWGDRHAAILSDFQLGELTKVYQ